MKVVAPPDALISLRPDRFTAPFWDAAREHRLVAARCAHCGTFRHPPAPFCHVCRRQDVTWVELPGTGRLYSFTIVHHPVVPDLAPFVPYVVGVVEVDGADGVRLVGNVVELDTQDVVVGLGLQVVWHDVQDWTVPRWRPA